MAINFDINIIPTTKGININAFADEIIELLKKCDFGEYSVFAEFNDIKFPIKRNDNLHDMVQRYYRIALNKYNTVK